MKKMQRLVLALLTALCALTLCACGKMHKELIQMIVTPPPTASPEVLRLDGGWYGYWSVNDAGGDWKKLDGYWWDCCGEVSGNGDELALLLWDENMDRENYLAMIKLQAGDSGYNCTGGDFLDAPIVPGNTMIQLENDDGRLLLISGEFDDAETGSFHYSFRMRPWGDEWTENERRPYYYDDWYLPKIEAGDAVPDEIRPN